MKYVTCIEANSETIDFLSIHCANVAHQDSCISLEIDELIRNSTKSNLVRKYLCFKAKYSMEEGDIPSVKALVALEYVTICAKTYLGFIAKRPAKDQAMAIEEEKNKLRHLYKLFVEKAENFYTKL